MSRILAEDRAESGRSEARNTFYVTIRPNFDRIGKLTDISTEGIAFEYLAYGKCEEIKCVEVDIFSRIDDLHLSRIPCKVIYDIKAFDYPTFDNVEIRRCGLEFQKLTPLHLKKLKYLQNSCDTKFDLVETR